MKINSVHFNFNKTTARGSGSYCPNINYMSAPIGDRVCFGDSISEKVEAAKAARKERKQEIRLEAEKKHQYQTQYHPATAFLYDPDLKTAQKIEMAKNQPNIRNLFEFANDLKVSPNCLKVWIKTKVLEADQLDTSLLDFAQLIDTEFEPNKAFMETLRQKLPTSVSCGVFMTNNNIKESQLRKCLINKQAVALGVEYNSGLGIDNLMIDTSDPLNQALAKRVHRQRPVPSKSYFRGFDYTKLTAPIMVPVGYLSKLGFGSPQKLTKMILDGRLAGTANKIEPEGAEGKARYCAKVDITDYIKSEEVLKDLRAANPDVATIQDLARQEGVKIADIKYWLQNGDIDIIKEYIFSDDFDTAFINKKDPKNSTFLEEIRLRIQMEEELQRAQKEEHAKEAGEKKQKDDRENSLRMKITWYLCPYTRELLKAEVQGDKHLGSIIAKDEKDEPLTSYESQTLGSYRQRVWDKKQAKEAFSEAHRKAAVVMEQIRTGGLGSVSDPEIVKIVNNHNLAYEE